MVTPLDKKLGVDYEGLSANVKFQIANGVSGLVPLGTTGESPTIDNLERKRVIETVVVAAGGKVPVIVGTGTNSTASTIAHSKEAEELGADAVLIVSPYYNKAHAGRALQALRGRFEGHKHTDNRLQHTGGGRAST